MRPTKVVGVNFGEISITADLKLIGVGRLRVIKSFVKSEGTVKTFDVEPNRSIFGLFG
jgi:hypothetical protein